MRASLDNNHRFMLIIICFLLLSAIKLSAQSTELSALTNNKNALINLINGIKSENEGVKRSSIYFAGKYRVNDVEDILIEQLSDEENPANRILIALVLYRLNSENGLDIVKRLYLTDTNSKVRRICKHIYREFSSNISGNRNYSLN